MGVRLTWSTPAQQDLAELESYIGSDDPAAASAVVSQLLERVDRLREYPEMGPIIQEFRDRSVRHLVVGNYRILYRLSADRMELEVARIWHGARGKPEIHPTP
jgi:toxin ParE1/3/4